jgi:hypothetical protein
MNKYKNVLLIAACFVAGLLGTFAGGVLRAQTGGSGQINACVNNSIGNVRILQSGDTCKNNETPLSWNAQGGIGGISGLEVVWESAYDRGEATNYITVLCPPGKMAIGGGVDNNFSNALVFRSRPYGPDIAGSIFLDSGEPEPLANGSSTTPLGWTVGVGNPNVTVTAYAICVNAGS